MLNSLFLFFLVLLSRSGQKTPNTKTTVHEKVLKRHDKSRQDAHTVDHRTDCGPTTEWGNQVESFSKEPINPRLGNVRAELLLGFSSSR